MVNTETDQYNEWVMGVDTLLLSLVLVY